MRHDGNRKSENSGHKQPIGTQCTNVRALYDCLSYLMEEARDAEFHELAHLIGVAAKSAEDAMRDLINGTKGTQ